MAAIFRALSSDDVASTRTLLHENVPVTGTIVSGSTYEDNNIKINVSLAKESPIGVDTEEDFVAIKKIMEYKS